MESRLIYLKASDLEAMYKKAGASTPVTSKPTRVVTDQGTITATQANAQMQEANRNANTQDSTYQTYIDPNTGRDVRYNYNQYGVRDYEMTNPNAQMFDVTTRGIGSNVQKQSPVLESPFAAGYRDPRNPSGYIPSGAVVGNDRNLFPEAQAGSAESLKAFAAKRRDERIQSLQQGLGVTFDPKTIEALQNGATFTGSTNGRATFQMPDGTIVTTGDDANIGQSAAEVYGTDYEKQITEEQQRQQEQQKQDYLDNQTIDPNNPDGTPKTPEQILIETEQQKYENALNTLKGDNADMMSVLLNGGEINGVKVTGINETLKDVTKQIEDLKSGYISDNETIKQLLETAKEENDKALAEQQKSEEERLFWNEVQDNRRISKQKRLDHEAMVANYALLGASLQPGALADVAASDAEYEDKIRDLAVVYGYQRNDLAARYSALYAQNNQNYVNESVANIKELRSNLERLTNQGITNTIALRGKEQELVTNAWNVEVGLQQALAESNRSTAMEIAGIIREERIKKERDGRQKMLDAWGMLMEAKQTFGSNIPISLVRDIARDLPGVDVEEFAKAKTWTEIKEEMDNASSSTLNSVINAALENDEGVGSTDRKNVDIVRMIDRVARSYGKTADERNEYKQDIAQMIIDGASEEDILNTLKTDYWIGQTGPVKTSRDSRQATLAGIESIRMILDKYGITPENDSVLGPFSSKTQKALSIVGMSSEAYNELSAIVGRIRAEVVHDLYGAAVTPQELALAQAFLPDLNLKGEKFFANLDGLEKQTQYLDDLYFADAVGSQKPQNPFSNIQNDNAGGNYNNNYIENILNPSAMRPPENSYGVGSLLKLGSGLSQDFNTKISTNLYAASTVKAWKGRHAGIDIKIPQGTDLPAPFGGTIISVGYEPGWGGTVKWRDDTGGEHRIAHMSLLSKDLKPGLVFKAGAWLGKSGGAKGTKGAGNSTGPHVDYRIRKNGEYIDPLTYVII